MQHYVTSSRCCRVLSTHTSYSGRTRFESQSGCRLSCLFPWFFSLHANTGPVPSNRPRPFYSESCDIHAFPVGQFKTVEPTDSISSNRYELYWRMGRCYRGLGQIPKARVSLQLALTLLGEYKDHIGPMEMIASSIRLQNEISQLEMEQTNLQVETPSSKGTVAYLRFHCVCVCVWGGG
jgi:hypothetical protein